MFERSAASADAVWRPRVTVATVVEDGGRFLLVEESIRGELVLNQPAGHLERNESLLDAAVRETLEETGWTVALTGFVGAYQWNTPDGSAEYLRFTFAARPGRHDAQRALDEGIVRALWLTREEIAAQPQRHRSPMVLGNIDDWLAGRRFPLDAVRSLLAGAAL
ncbi:MAG: NUDIX hydrolase [Rudaea sp.]|uniref:NUDIX hydrolase n=1 Tax=Rudaea sp. TaxID=2136325 RepID=UPI0039E51BBD